MQYIGPTIKYYYSKCFLLVNYVKCKACMANLSQISQFLLQFTGQLLVGFSSSLYGTAHFVLILFLAHGLSLSKQENKLQKQNQNNHKLMVRSEFNIYYCIYSNVEVHRLRKKYVQNVLVSGFAFGFCMEFFFYKNLFGHH